MYVFVVFLVSLVFVPQPNERVTACVKVRANLGIGSKSRIVIPRFSKCLVQCRPDFRWADGLDDENLLAKGKSLMRQMLGFIKKRLLAPLLWRVGTRSRYRVVRSRTLNLEN